MKTFFVVTLALCCLAIFTPAHAWTKLDVENFILGLGEGLEVRSIACLFVLLIASSNDVVTLSPSEPQNDFSQNITLCIKDEMTAFQEFETAFNDLKAGIKHKSVHEIRVGLQGTLSFSLPFEGLVLLSLCPHSIALGNGLKDASAILKDCGFETMGISLSTFFITLLMFA